MSGFTIREAMDSDLPVLSRLAELALDLDVDDAADVPGYIWGEVDGGKRVRLAAVADASVRGIAIGTVLGHSAYLDFICVDPTSRRNGVGKLLMDEWERKATELGASHLGVGGNPQGYAWPGVDIRYTAALCLLLARGYGRVDVVYNMDLPLTGELGPSDAQIDKLRTHGVTVRRIGPDDEDLVTEYASSTWRDSWAREMALSARNVPPTGFLAFRDNQVVGFAAHGVYRPCVYGPIATDPSVQGTGVGRVLSGLCLADMASRGITTAQITWVAEDAIPFYSRTVGARMGRCFWMLTKAQNPRSANA